MAASVVSGYLMMLKASMRLRLGTALRGYFGLRGNLKVLGRRKRTVVRTLRRRVPNGPLTAWKKKIIFFVKFFVEVLGGGESIEQAQAND